MATFLNAINFVLQNEGGFLQDEDGKTMWGILENEARAYGYTGPMETMPQGIALEIYRTKFWSGLDAVQNQAVATKLLDLRVNFGMGGGTLIAQRALNQFEGINLTEDGGFGPLTLQAVNAVDPRSFLESLVDEASDRYRGIAARNPAKQKYLKGWLDRAMRLPEFIQNNPGTTALGVVLLAALLGSISGRKG